MKAVPSASVDGIVLAVDWRIIPPADAGGTDSSPNAIANTALVLTYQSALISSLHD